MATPVPLATTVHDCTLPPVKDHPFPALVTVESPAIVNEDVIQDAANSMLAVDADRTESVTSKVSPTTDAVL